LGAFPFRHIYSSNNPLSYGKYLFEMGKLPIEFINISMLYSSQIPVNNKVLQYNIGPIHEVKKFKLRSTYSRLLFSVAWYSGISE
jgi:hypothetical protein